MRTHWFKANTYSSPYEKDWLCSLRKYKLFNLMLLSLLAIRLYGHLLRCGVSKSGGLRCYLALSGVELLRSCQPSIRPAFLESGHGEQPASTTSDALPGSVMGASTPSRSGTSSSDQVSRPPGQYLLSSWKGSRGETFHAYPSTSKPEAATSRAQDYLGRSSMLSASPLCASNPPTDTGPSTKKRS